MSRLFRWLRYFVFLALLGIGFVRVPQVAAQTSVACNTTDLVNAIYNASDGDTLSLAAGCIYVLTGPIPLTFSGLPTIGVDLTINGNGATIERSTAGGTSDFRLITINVGAAVSLNDLALGYGKASGENGGAIFNAGVLTVNRCTFADNAATGIGWGGAISNGTYTETATLTVNDSSFWGNSAADGGAITNYWGFVTVSNSTFSLNLAGDMGGAIYNYDGYVTVTNSTLDNNDATHGGAIFNESGQTAKIGSTLVAGNSGQGLKGTFNSLGYNLIGNTAGGTYTGSTATDLTDDDAKPINVEALGENGGSTQTMALDAGSMAIGHGNCTSLSGIPPVTTDQRGVSRRLPCDIGAYKSSLPATLLIAQLFDDTSYSIVYSGNWGTSSGSYSGGTMHFTGQHNASLSFLLKGGAGNRLTLVRSTGPDRGNMQVCIGAGVCQTYSNYSQIPLYQQPLTILVPNDGNFTVTMTNLGISGQYMDFDAVYLLPSPGTLNEGGNFQDGNASISYSGQWIVDNNASYSSGKAHYTGVPNSSYTFLINATAGDRLEIIRTVGPDKGPMRVCFSEVFACQTFSNSNPITLYQQPFTISAPWTGVYPVTVTFTGSNGQYLDLDKLSLLIAPTILIPGGGFDSASPNLTYNGVWIGDSSPDYYDGSVMYTGQNGASVSFTVTTDAGDLLIILRTAAPDHGLMQLCIGVQCTTYSNYGLPTAYRQAINILMPNAGTFPVTLTNLGSSGQYMDFDAVILSAGSPTALDEGVTYQETSGSLYYSGQWVATDNASYSGGHAYYTSQPDSTVTFMVNGVAGHYLVLYRTKGPDKGPMEVCFSQVYNCTTISNSHGSNSVPAADQHSAALDGHLPGDGALHRRAGSVHGHRQGGTEFGAGVGTRSAAGSDGYANSRGDRHAHARNHRSRDRSADP